MIDRFLTTYDSIVEPVLVTLFLLHSSYYLAVNSLIVYATFTLVTLCKICVICGKSY